MLGLNLESENLSTLDALLCLTTSGLFSNLIFCECDVSYKAFLNN